MIFNSRSSNWTSIHQFYDSTSTRLGYRVLVFALTTNLELGPRFAEIWCHLKTRQKYPVFSRFYHLNIKTSVHFLISGAYNLDPHCARWGLLFGALAFLVDLVFSPWLHKTNWKMICVAHSRGKTFGQNHSVKTRDTFLSQFTCPIALRISI